MCVCGGAGGDLERALHKTTQWSMIEEKKGGGTHRCSNASFLFPLSFQPRSSSDIPIQFQNVV